MSTQTLRQTLASRAARKADEQARDHAAASPATNTVAARLAKLNAASVPWLSKDVDLTPQDGGPEIVGPAEYPPPTRA